MGIFYAHSSNVYVSAYLVWIRHVVSKAVRYVPRHPVDVAIFGLEDIAFYALCVPGHGK